jgi:molybdenum cofactor synthesis domain-containing protein
MLRGYRRCLSGWHAGRANSAYIQASPRVLPTDRTPSPPNVFYGLQSRASAMRVAVLTISDAGARGERADTSGDAAAEWAASEGAQLVARALVPDDTVRIVRQLLAWCDDDVADLVLTTGGTGLSPRDVTPEATSIVIEREAPGIAERIRIGTGSSSPRSALGRGVAGVRARTLIVNQPGSTNGVTESLSVLAPLARHAVAILRGALTDHTIVNRER